jgi:hypothetical protein
MKNLWPEKFAENQQITAKSIFEEQAKLLSTVTEGIVFGEVSPLEGYQVSIALRNDLVFRFDIVGKFLKNYRFNVLSFSHDITLYPVKVELDETISKELGIIKGKDSTIYLVELNTADFVEVFLGRVLHSERLKNVIGSILRLSH